MALEKNHPLLVETDRGFSIYYKNKYLYSRYSALSSVQKISSSIHFHENTLYILAGPLLLYGLQDLLDKLPKTSLIIGVEADERLAQWVQNSTQRLSVTSSQFSYWKTSDFQTLPDFLDQSHNFHIRRAELLSLNGSYALNPQAYTALIHYCDLTIQGLWQNRSTAIHMSHLWHINIFKNLLDLTNTFSANHVSTKKPVLVAAAGESLESSLSSIKEYRSSYFLLAVDTAIGTLFQAGIKPDAILILESQFYNYYDFLDYKDSEVALFFDLSSYPLCKRYFRGLRFAFITRYAKTALPELLSKKLNIPLLDPLGSVGITALELASRITQENILYTGLDFCFPLGKPHATGAYTQRLSEYTHQRFSPYGYFTYHASMDLLCIDKSQESAMHTSREMKMFKELLQSYTGASDRFHDAACVGLKLSHDFTNNETLIYEKNSQIDSHAAEETAYQLWRKLDVFRDAAYIYLSKEQTAKQLDWLYETFEQCRYLELSQADRKKLCDQNYLKRLAATALFYHNRLHKFFTHKIGT